MAGETTTITQQPETTHPEDNGGSTGKTFTQDEVNRIVSDRLARDREKVVQPPQEDEREKTLRAREARLDCRDYLNGKKYPAELLDVLDSSDVDKFKAAADKLVTVFPNVNNSQIPPPYGAGTGTAPLLFADTIADAFRPKI